MFYIFDREEWVNGKNDLYMFCANNKIKIILLRSFYPLTFLSGSKVKKCSFSRFLHVFARQSQKLSGHILRMPIRSMNSVKVIFPIDPSILV